MENVRIQTAQNVGIDFEVAGLGDRAIAALLDYFLLFCYLIPAGLLAAEIGSTAVAVLLYLPVFLYFLLCEIFLEGQSIGKRVRKLKVARLDGAPPTLGDYVVRWLLRFVDLDLSLGAVALLTVFINGKGQRLGDVAAGTTVVRIAPRTALRDTLFARLDDTYTPTFLQVEALDDHDIATAKEVLHALMADRRSPITRDLEMSLKTAFEHKMGLASTLPAAEFLRTVVNDYNYIKGRV